MTGHTDIAAMADGFMAEFPDTVLSLDTVLIAGDDAVLGCTFEGYHRDTGRRARLEGWEKRDIGPVPMMHHSQGWFDAGDYERQLQGG